MIKMITSYTEEIDYVDIAVSEILDKLDLSNQLLKNSIGLVHAYYEFIDSGVIQALAAKLPFDIAGVTTVSSSVPGFISDMGLTLTVLTSDDVEFAAGVSSPVETDLEGPLAELYSQVTSKLSGKPSLLLTFFPLTRHVGGDEFVAQVDALSGGIPQFGTLSISDDPGFVKSSTIFNGVGNHSTAVLVALAGEVNPSFFTVSVDDEIISRDKGVVTKATRNIMQCIDGMPALKYLESVGVIEAGNSKMVDNLPVVLYPEDGSRLIRATMLGTAEGDLILAGTAPVNSKVAFSTISAAKVESSAEKIIKETMAAAKKEDGSVKNCLIYSCVSRLWALGVIETAEHEIAEKILGASTPYHFAYSGGEIIPSLRQDGSAANHQQNYSLIVCVL
ncbi:MAG: FIST C-terminal domain-containing protein [Treponema sp.]|jgi:hypothetical protein|nr:FIST C-terminal domain-containing protein [Treponema sp.]